MKTLLLDSAPVPKNPTTAHCRTGIEASKYLNIPLLGSIEEIEKLNPKEYKKIVVFGSAFYPKTAEIEYWIRQVENPVVIWINNEYSCSPNSEYARLIKDYESIVVSNVIEKANKVKNYNEFHLLNLNSIIAQEINQTIFKKYDLIYFGTYRVGRRIYLQKYFSENDFYLSSSKKNIRKFNQLAGCKSIFCDKLDWTKSKETLNLFKYSLYIEDEFTHQNFNHFANRFYECIYCNVVQFFDANCINTINKSILYDIDDYFIVSNHKELKEKIADSNYYDLLEKQKAWAAIALQEKEDTLKKLTEIIS